MIWIILRTRERLGWSLVEGEIYITVSVNTFYYRLTNNAIQ
jgi:hypothetical protein